MNAGSGSEYGPAYMVDNDVILVTFNYRLGPLGFMSTGDMSRCAIKLIENIPYERKWLKLGMLVPDPI